MQYSNAPFFWQMVECRFKTLAIFTVFPVLKVWTVTYFYCISMTLMMLSVILLAMLIAATRVGFWAWIWPTGHFVDWKRSDLLISIPEKFSIFQEVLIKMDEFVLEKKIILWGAGTVFYFWTKGAFQAAKIRKEVFDVWTKTHFTNFELGWRLNWTFPQSRKCLSVVCK